jgi:hypothetical protein
LLWNDWWLQATWLTKCVFFYTWNLSWSRYHACGSCECSLELFNARNVWNGRDAGGRRRLAINEHVWALSSSNFLEFKKWSWPSGTSSYYYRRQMSDYLPPTHEADRSTNYSPPRTNSGARTTQDIQLIDTPCTSGPPPPFISDLNNHLDRTSVICNHAPWPIGPPQPIPSPINPAGSVVFNRYSSTFNTFGIGQTQRGDLGLSPTYTFGLSFPLIFFDWEKWSWSSCNSSYYYRNQQCYHPSNFHQGETLHYLPLRISPPQPAVSSLGFRTDASGSASITRLEPPESSPLEVVRCEFLSDF